MRVDKCEACDGLRIEAGFPFDVPGRICNCSEWAESGLDEIRENYHTNLELPIGEGPRLIAEAEEILVRFGPRLSATIDAIMQSGADCPID